MARTSGRLSRGSNADTPRKRHPSTTAVPSERPKRAKTKTTPTKSQYFKAHDNASQILEDSDPTEEASSAQNHSSDFHNDGSTDAETDEDNDTGDERTKPTPVNAETSAAPGKVKVQDLLKPGVTTGLGPGRQVVIKKPKARPAGTTPYADETIHPNTLMFLEDLKANNNRQWLKRKFCLSLHSRYLGRMRQFWKTTVFYPVAAPGFQSTFGSWVISCTWLVTAVHDELQSEQTLGGL